MAKVAYRKSAATLFLRIIMILGAYFTITEVAALLNKDRDTIARWLKKGKIQGELRLGNMAPIPEAEVKKLRCGTVLG